MKKSDIINLIRAYAEKDDYAFKTIANNIALEFDRNGDNEIASYISSLLSGANSFVPQVTTSGELKFFKIMRSGYDHGLYLNDLLHHQFNGILNALKRHGLVNKFLFFGPSGTGKTQSVFEIARITGKVVYSVNFNSIIDYKLGETAKNLESMFDELKHITEDSSALILFDEIDALVLDRVRSNDIREMGRVTSTFLKELDSLPKTVPIFATTNLYQQLDEAIVRRFDSKIDFSKYSKKDCDEIALKIYSDIANRTQGISVNGRLFEKITKLNDKIIYPGDYTNIIEHSIAFSDYQSKNNYFSLLYMNITGSDSIPPIQELKQQGFTIREIEILTNMPRTTISRKLTNE